MRLVLLISFRSVLGASKGTQQVAEVAQDIPLRGSLGCERLGRVSDDAQLPCPYILKTAGADILRSPGLRLTRWALADPTGCDG